MTDEIIPLVNASEERTIRLGFTCPCGEKNGYHPDTYSGGIAFCAYCKRIFYPVLVPDREPALIWKGTFRCEDGNHDVTFPLTHVKRFACPEHAQKQLDSIREEIVKQQKALADNVKMADELADYIRNYHVQIEVVEYEQRRKKFEKIRSTCQSVSYANQLEICTKNISIENSEPLCNMDDCPIVNPPVQKLLPCPKCGGLLERGETTTYCHDCGYTEDNAE